MAREGHVVVGSGMKPNIDGTCERKDGRKYMTGTNVVVINPEDASAGGMFQTTQIDIGGVATQIVAAPLEYRRSVAIRNKSIAGTLYLGETSSVTTSTGFPVEPGEVFQADINGKCSALGHFGCYNRCSCH
jgi:hypothetical protein